MNQVEISAQTTPAELESKPRGSAWGRIRAHLCKSAAGLS